MPQSHRARLLIAFLAVVLSSLALFMGLTLLQFGAYSRNARVQELRLRLKLLSSWVDPPSPQAKDALRGASAEWGAALLVYGGERQPRVYVSEGFAIPDADLARVKIILERELAFPRATTLTSEDLTLILQPMNIADQTTGLLAAAIPSGNLIAGWQHLLDAMIPAALFGLIISTVLAVWLARSIARPVTRLTVAANRMAQGIFDDPPLPASRDELGHLTRAFDAMRVQVRDAQQRQRDFLTNVSHDLKTPLAIVQGYASALADGAADTESARQRALTGIQRETERMTRLIGALLELARLEAGLTPFHPVALDLAELARQVIADLAPPTEGPRIVDALPPAFPTLQADPTQIERVLTNLLENALRFTPRDGVITVGGAVEPAGNIALWVQDAGPGIAPDALPHVFDRFYQADPARSTGRIGSGLGLTIAREIARRHGGDLTAASQPGQGARFTLTLPA